MQARTPLQPARDEALGALGPLYLEPLRQASVEPPVFDEWHTAKETAAMLGIGRTRLRVSGLPHVRVGRRCFYLRSVIEANRPWAATTRRADFCRDAFTVHPRWTDEFGDSQPMYKHSLYYVWRGMIDRCYVGHDRLKWHYYGGRGIRVYEPWRDLVTFIRDVEASIGPRPAGKTFDRWPDNDGNYWPGNVKWSTREEQASNRGSVLDRPICFCKSHRVDCALLPGVCPFEDVPWLVTAEYVHEQLRRIEAARDAPLPPLVRHLHTGGHDDCFACVNQDPFSGTALLGDEISPYEHCRAAAGYTHRHLAPLGLFGT